MDDAACFIYTAIHGTMMMLGAVFGHRLVPPFPAPRSQRSFATEAKSKPLSDPVASVEVGGGATVFVPGAMYSTAVEWYIAWVLLSLWSSASGLLSACLAWVWLAWANNRHWSGHLGGLLPIIWLILFGLFALMACARQSLANPQVVAAQ